MPTPRTKWRSQAISLEVIGEEMLASSKNSPFQSRLDEPNIKDQAVPFYYKQTKLKP